MWEKYGDMMKWGGGAVLLFVLALGVFSLLFSGDDNPSSPNVNGSVENPVDPIILPVDSPVVDPVVIPTPKPNPFSGKGRKLSPTPKPIVDKEEEFWKKCKKADNVFIYDDYLKIFPKGKHRNEARKRIQEIESDGMSSNKVRY